VRGHSFYTSARLAVNAQTVSSTNGADGGFGPMRALNPAATLVSVNSMDEHGLTLTKARPGAAKGQPFAFLVNNDRDDTILTLTVHWQLTYTDSRKPQDIYRIYLNWRDQEEPMIAPHSSMTIFLMDFAGGAPDPGMVSTVSVALDAVILANGLVLGPDKGYLQAAIQGKHDALRDLSTTLTRKTEQGEQASLTNWLHGVRRGAERTLVEKPKNKHEAAYASSYSMYKEQLADELLSIERVQGAGAVNEYAKQVAARPHLTLYRPEARKESTEK
jgi:hypothetical protein